MKKLIVVSVLLIIVFPCLGEQLDSVAILQGHLSEAIEVKSNNTIGYCPDNTCDIYISANNTKQLSEFVYLHLFHKSGYTYLEERILKNKAFRVVAKGEPLIRKDAEPFCFPK